MSKCLEPDQYLNKQELQSLLKRADELYVLGLEKKSHQKIKQWFLIYFALFTGCRASEIANVVLGDLNATNNQLHIRRGKGDKSRTITFGKHFKNKILKPYLKYLADNFDDLTADTYLFRSGRGKGNKPYTATGIWYLWKKNCDKKLHSSRHTAASNLYLATQNLQAVKTFLGHSHLNTCSIYLHNPLEVMEAGNDAYFKMATSKKAS
jgi:integrase/recombinase XerD